MFNKYKKNLSALLAKPKGTKICVPDKSKVQFFRGKLGQSLYPDMQDVNLGGPKLCDYHCLHDKNLKKFFSHPEKKKQLVELGFISQDGKVQCSLKECNDYVEHLRSIPLKQDTSEFKPSLYMTCQSKGFSHLERKEQRMKQKLDQDEYARTLQTKTLERDDDQVLEFQMEKETEELQLVDLEDENFHDEVAEVSVEDLIQTPGEEKVEMEKEPEELQLVDLEDENFHDEVAEVSVEDLIQTPGEEKVEMEKEPEELQLVDLEDENFHDEVAEVSVEDLIQTPGEEKVEMEKEPEELQLVDQEDKKFQDEVAEVSVEDLIQTPGEEKVEMATSKPLLSPKTEKKLSLTDVQESSSTREKMEETSKSKNVSRGSAWSIFKRLWKAITSQLHLTSS